jgi:hypothetical protein
LEVPTDKGAEMPKTAVIVTTKAEVSIIDIAEGSLKKLQSAVDGLIQPIDLNADVTMWVNEEGLLRNDLEMNDIATSLYAQMYDITNPLMGDVVFTGGTDEEGETLGLADDYVNAIYALVDNYKQVMSQFA